MSKEVEAIKNFLKHKKVLIASDNTTDRTTWKKIFIELGASTSNLLNATSIAEAIEIINDNDVHIVFSAYSFDRDTAIEIIDTHTLKFPDRSNHIYIMASDKNSLAVAACAAEHDIDALLIKPYNINDLNQSVSQAINSKINLSKEMKFYYEIRKDIVDGNFDQALEKANHLKEKKPESALPFVLHGLIEHTQGNLENAIKVWVDGLEKDSIHHTLLHKIFDTYIDLKQFKEAYPYSQTLCEKYPINPERIPNLIRVSLSTENYQNLIDFCKMILDVESNLRSIQRPVAAALAICAKNLAGDEDNYELVKEASLKAMELTEHTSQIYFTCLENLIANGDYRIAHEKLDEIPTDDMTKDLLFLELKVLNMTEKTKGEAFIKAQSLLKLDYKTSEFYKILLELSVHTGKKAAYIEELVFDAIKLYPNEEEEFKKFLS